MAKNGSDRLESWKEIAAYLGRNQRTAMRWAELGMPVHRDPGAKRGRVFAYRAELDSWLTKHGSSPTLASSQPQGRRYIGVAVGAVFLAVTAIGGLFLLNNGERRVLIDSVAIHGDELIARGTTGRELWRYRFPAGFRQMGPWGPTHSSRKVRLVDLFGDGKGEVLAVVHFAIEHNNDEILRTALYCFSRAGKLLWKYEPDQTLRFAGGDFHGHWSIYDMLISSEGRQRTIWLAIAHRLWWPSYVVRLDPSTGQGQVQFVNSGTLHSLGLAKSSRGSYLLIGGFNNEYDAGILCVMDANRQFASSPQGPRSKYLCKSCSSGAPDRYIVFPRYELNRLQEIPLNTVGQIEVLGNDIEVSTHEVDVRARAIYVFALDPNFTLKTVSFSDTYWKVHRQLEAEGRTKHPPEQCPDHTRPQPLRVWTPKDGWSSMGLAFRPN